MRAVDTMVFISRWQLCVRAGVGIHYQDRARQEVEPETPGRIYGVSW